MAIPVKQNNWAKKLRKLNCKWFYSWGSKLPEGVPAGVDFKPMIWGYWGDAKGLVKTGNMAKAAGIKELLGFNEPDQRDQSNMSVE